MAAKIVGVLFLLAGYAWVRRARRTRTRSGGGRTNPSKLQVAGAREILGAVVCLIAAYLCLLHSVAHAW